MPDFENDTLADSLQGYKGKITPITRATLAWNKDLFFTGATPQGYEIDFDANSQMGCKPTEALLLSLAGCMGIDVVMILQKMRAALTSFKMELTGQRNSDPPQYFKAVEIVLHIAGEGIDPRKVERAVSLSREKYCSVFNSLRKDLDLNVRWELEEAAGK